ncbi:MAG: hypothetical protein JWM11_3824 [Planctomycetaceae bacterium]|nr:hypothetical protein [Planctomycetaceae bacterium]
MTQRKIWIAVLTLVLLGGVVWIQTQDDTPPVEVVLLTEANWDKFAPRGKEVDAIAGDLVLRNKYLTAVIAQPLESRNANMTVKNVAGALIDLTTRDDPSDQLSAYYPGQQQYAYREWQVLGLDDRLLELQPGTEMTARYVTVVVRAPARDGKPGITVRYRLENDEPYLTVTTEFTNSTTQPMDVSLADDLRIDSGKELMVKTPNGAGTLFWAHDRYWKQAYAVGASGLKLEINSDARLTTIKYEMFGEHKKTLMPGEKHQFTRWLFVGRDLLEAKALASDMRGDIVPRVEIRVVGEDGGIADAEVFFQKAGVAYGSARTDHQGVLHTALPLGEYTYAVQTQGVEIAKDLRYVQERRDSTFQEFRVPGYQSGKVQARITDADGKPIPCKVEFKAKPGTPQPDFGPATGSFAVKNLRYAPLGSFEQTLLPGEYDVVISHGPEYDALFVPLKVTGGKTAELAGKLIRSVDTKGWISSDFHSHSSPSGDNTSSQTGRVLNHVCEHLEFVPCTEHNRIDTYQPLINELGVGSFVSTVSGIELTGLPLPLNHQNAFPMLMRLHTQDGGGPLPDADPATQIERLALWDKRSEKLVQVNHPDLGWMFYDKDGNGESDAGFERMRAHINVLEVHPIDCILKLAPQTQRNGMEFNNTMFNWLQLLNQGLRIPGVVNTDAHDNYHGTGWLRNFIQSTTDDPAAIQPLDVVRAANQGRLVMSNGPFMEVRLNEMGQDYVITAGQDLAALSGKLSLKVKIQTPNWFDIDRVFVLVNGRSDESLNFTREKHPERFQTKGAVRFDQTLQITLTRDSHLIVVATGEKSSLERIYSSDSGKVHPVAVSNPMFVDIDSAGFTANKDTLGHPLPRKFTARKLDPKKP